MDRLHLTEIIERWSAICGLDDVDFSDEWWRSRCREKGIHLDQNDTAAAAQVDEAIGPPLEPVPAVEFGRLYCRSRDKRKPQAADAVDRIPMSDVRRVVTALLREEPTPEAMGIFMAKGGLTVTDDEQHLLSGHDERDIFRAWEKNQNAVRARQKFTRHKNHHTPY